MLAAFAVLAAVAFAGGAIAVLLFAWVPHWILLWLDTAHRAQGDALRKAWPFKTITHIKSPLTVASNTLAQWRLVTHEGRQRWIFVGKSGTEPLMHEGADAPPTEELHRTQSAFERYQLGLAASPMTREAASSKRKAPHGSSVTATDALNTGVAMLSFLQDPKTGHWPNDYSGPLFLLPGAVFAKYVISEGRADAMWPAAYRNEMRRYIINTQTEDGGWGLHTESHSTMFGTTINYIALRMLGEAADSRYATAARDWLHRNGGAVSIPSWGKAWLSILGLYSWDGCNPVPPEMWFLPDWCPISMGRVWCHSRVVTLPFGYFYGKRYQMKPTELITELRDEIYTLSYDSIDWSTQRDKVHRTDIYTPHSGFYTFANLLLRAYEHVAVPFLRRRAIAFAIRHMKYDDQLTDYICLGPVNKALNMLVTYLEEGAGSPALARHMQRLDDYMWLGPEGLRMNGYNGSQLWDTSFAAQALICTVTTRSRAANDAAFVEALHGAPKGLQTVLAKAYKYIDVAQVRQNAPYMKEYYHSPTKGCWNFSTRDQAWQVSDCTAEGLRIALLLRGVNFVDHPIADSRLEDAVDVVLSLRDVNGDGGWASYEEPRAPRYMELLNCAELYKDIMIDYTYVECTSSCVHSLILFRDAFPDYRSTAVTDAIEAGVNVIKAKQRADGSWYGSWGNSFTYAAWLASEALHLAGERHETCDALQRCCAFVVSRQNADGGWGEDFNSCVTCEYVPSPDGSQVVNTAWAVMTLLTAAEKRFLTEAERGLQFLVGKQRLDGDWDQTRIMGVFNGNCAIHYPGYKNCMPVWALGKYRRVVGEEAFAQRFLL